MTVYWRCLGIPPRVPPCGASGTGDRAAEQHTKATQHGTATSIRPPQETP